MKFMKEVTVDGRGIYSYFEGRIAAKLKITVSDWGITSEFFIAKSSNDVRDSVKRRLVTKEISSSPLPIHIL